MNSSNDLQIFKLENQIQNYAWGSRTFIPELLGKDTNLQEPQAELWMGTHPQASSQIKKIDKNESLRDAILSNPIGMLGEKISRQYSNNLPFLFKVLAAANPLSIQAHPNKAQAEAGYRFENKENIPLDSIKRNYKDNNHKPELIYALTDFEVLCGFQPIRKIVNRFKYFQLDEIILSMKELEMKPSAENLKKMFANLMNIQGFKQTKLVNILRKKTIELQPRDEKETLIFKWIRSLISSYPDDMGVLAPLFLNVIKLKPGEALFIESGVLHSYLIGCGIEIMANSDNVLRGGLTSKNVDIPELLQILNFDNQKIEIIQPDVNNNETIYKTSAQEFQLSKIKIHDHQSFINSKINSPEIMLCTTGSGKISWKDSVLEMQKGESIFVPFSISEYKLEGTMELFRAVVPLM